MKVTKKGRDTISVFALKYGETKTLPNYAAYWMSTRYFPEVRAVDTALYYWLVRTHEHNILVDVGMTREGAAQRNYTNYVAPDAMLRKVGLEPSDIDAVIITHTHSDHVDALDWYKNAKVYVQRECYRFTVEEGAEYAFFRRTGYPTRKDALALFNLLWDNRLKLLDGDAELFPGLKVIRVDGHYPGLQLVVVRTKDDHPMGLYFGALRDLVKGFETIRQLNGIVVPGHDPEVMIHFKQIDKEVVRIHP